MKATKTIEFNQSGYIDPVEFRKYMRKKMEALDKMTAKQARDKAVKIGLLQVTPAVRKKNSKKGT